MLSPISYRKIGERFVCLDCSPGLPSYRGGPFIEGPYTQPREGLGGIPAVQRDPRRDRAGQQNELFYLPLLCGRGMVVAIFAQAIFA